MARQSASPRDILVLIDADDDCPKELAPQLAARAVGARSDVTTAIVLVKFEFEAWFLAAIESLGGHRGLPDSLATVPDPESLRDPKGHLRRLMTGGRAYSETIDQPALAAVFDIQVARQRSASFDKCRREMERLLATLSGQIEHEGHNPADILWAAV